MSDATQPEARRGDEGYTVAEQAVVVFVLGIVMAIVLGFLTQATERTTRADSNVRAEQSAIVALRTVTEDLRSARDDSLAACAGFTYDTCLTFEISKVTTGSGSCPKRVARYWVQGTDLRQSWTDYAADCATVTSSGNRSLIEGVQSTSVFSFYKSDGVTALNLPTDNSLVKDTPAIKVSLSVKYRNNVAPLSLSSFASLRNNRTSAGAP